MQVVGFCRFSYPAEGGFQVEHEDIATREAYLYSAARMDERFRHFETICLPGLKAQTDPDFTFLILVGSSLPAELRARLEAARAQTPESEQELIAEALAPKEAAPARKEAHPPEPAKRPGPSGTEIRPGLWCHAGKDGQLTLSGPAMTPELRNTLLDWLKARG